MMNSLHQTASWTSFLVVGMLVTGTINTLLNKLQDLVCVENCDSIDEAAVSHFEQPIWQSINMFMGEACCLIVYLIIACSTRSRNDFTQELRYPIITSDDDNVNVYEAGGSDNDSASTLGPFEEGDMNVTMDHRLPMDQSGSLHSHSSSTEHLLPPTDAFYSPNSISDSVLPEDALNQPLKGWNILWLILPTICDLSATTLMNVGLIYTSASIYQMLRGSVVLFTGILSTIFLNRRHPLYRWLALFIVFLGISIVGLSSVIPGSEKSSNQIHGSAFGVCLVIIAQCFTAAQFVIEEKIMFKFKLPALLAVGLEGTYGLLIILLTVPLIQSTKVDTGGFFELATGYHQILSHPVLIWSGIGIIFSIALFNWFGLSVTKSISSTSRSTIDTCRTLFIWMASLGLGWETFKWMQVLGFVVLIYGSFVFNDVVALPFLKRQRPASLDDLP